MLSIIIIMIFNAFAEMCEGAIQIDWISSILAICIYCAFEKLFEIST